jgi:hypothetical protein
MITKVFVAAAFTVLAGVGVAAPASADPGSFADITCSCQDPVPQAFLPFVNPFADPVDQGIRQGLSDTTSDAIPR